MSDVHQRILQWLDGQGVAYRHLEHPPTRTSEQSAQARGAPLEIGGKTLLLLRPEGFGLFVLSAARKLDSRAVRKHFGVRRLRFATDDELRELTGVVPGCVPPLGRPIIDLDLFADPSVLANEDIAFNPGSLRHSIIMRTADWHALVRPEIFTFTKKTESQRRGEPRS